MAAGPVHHNVPESVLVGIGDVTVSFALLEKQVEFLAWVLLGDSERQRLGNIITAELSFLARCDLVLNLYREQFGTVAEFSELRELVERGRKLAAKRNRIIHSLWSPSFSNPDGSAAADLARRVKTTAKSKSGLTWDEEVVDGSDMAAVADDLKHLVGELLGFTVELSLAPPNGKTETPNS